MMARICELRRLEGTSAKCVSAQARAAIGSRLAQTLRISVRARSASRSDEIEFVNSRAASGSVLASCLSKFRMVEDLLGSDWGNSKAAVSICSVCSRLGC